MRRSKTLSINHLTTKEMRHLLLFALLSLIAGSTALSQSIAPQQWAERPTVISPKQQLVPFVGFSVGVPLFKRYQEKKTAKARRVQQSSVSGGSYDLYQMNVRKDTTTNSNPGPGATTNGDGEETVPPPDPNPPFGIQGGNGSEANPYLLSVINVVAQPQGAMGPSVSYGGGFYYSTGGQYNGETYADGYYQDPTYVNPNYNTGGTDPYDYQYKKEPADCNAYASFYQGSIDDGKERGGVITADGQLITLPTANNLPNQTDFGGVYQDAQGRTIATIYPDNSKWYIQLVDYSTTPGTPTVYELIGMVHTHPTGQAPDGNIYDTYNPSPNDLNLLSSYSGLSQYIRTPAGSYGFDSSGAKRNQKTPNCNR